MPADYRIDRQRGVVLSRAWGILTDGDLLDHQQRLRSDPHFTPSLNQLFEFQDVVEIRVTAGGIRLLADRNPFGQGSRRAFTVLATAMFGLLRMFEILTSEHPDDLRVQFNNVQGAREWLGIPEDPAKAG